MRLDTLRAWVEQTRARDVPTGLTIPEAIGLARAGWGTILKGKAALDLDTELLDVLHAASGHLAQGDPLPSRDRYLAASALFRGVRTLAWGHDDLGERHELLARFAYLAWNESRRLGRERGMARWERICLGEAEAQEDLANFLALPADKWSVGLSRRFLEDPVVMLAIVARLFARRNDEPSKVAAEATAAYSRVSSVALAAGAEEIQHFLAGLALVAAISNRFLGNFDHAATWLNLARQHATSTVRPTILLARIEFVGLGLLFERREFGAVITLAPALISKLSRLGMEQEATKARFAQASATKDVGQPRVALAILDLVLESCARTDDVLLRGLAFMTRGEVKASLGDRRGSQQDLQKACEDVWQSRNEWAQANVCGVLAEVHRDQGRLEAAAALYRVAVRIYDKLRMDHRGAYLRIVLAETLLLAGREADAIAELAAVVRFVEGKAFGAEARASALLLREALSRQQTDLVALRKLREQLQQTRKDGDQ